MTQKYERVGFTITEFDIEDVITTSTPDKDNRYMDVFDMVSDDISLPNLPPTL